MTKLTKKEKIMLRKCYEETNMKKRIFMNLLLNSTITLMKIGDLDLSFDTKKNNEAYEYLSNEYKNQVINKKFLTVMGSSPMNKVLCFLFESKGRYMSMNEISEGSEVGYLTLKLLLPKMLENNLIVINKKIGKIKLYSINNSSKIVGLIKDIYNITYFGENK